MDNRLKHLKSFDERINKYDKKHKDLIFDLENICKQYQVYLNSEDIKKALIEVSEIYTED